MTKTTHTLTATLAIGEAELELVITYTCLRGAPAQGPSYASGGQPADPDEVEFVSCKGPLQGDAYDDFRQSSYDMWAEDYLESDKGIAQALEVAASDIEDAREAAAELRADR